MQHIMSDAEYAEYKADQGFVKTAKINQASIERHFKQHCPKRNNMGYCDACPIQDTKDPHGRLFYCMAGLSMGFSKWLLSFSIGSARGITNTGRGDFVSSRA